MLIICEETIENQLKTSTSRILEAFQPLRRDGEMQGDYCGQGVELITGSSLITPVEGLSKTEK